MNFVLTTLILLTACSSIAAAQGFEEEDQLFVPPELVADGKPGKASGFYILRDWLPHRNFILPALFFDHPGDIHIPDRYQQFRSGRETEDYLDSGVVATTLQLRRMEIGPLRKYREILNVVGYRMRQHPDVVIGLRGGYSTEPGEDSAVAQERAYVVRTYLSDIWNIDTARLPLHPPESIVDSTDHILHQEEARTVTFVSLDWRVIRPVDYYEHISVPMDTEMEVRVKLNVDPDQISSIELRVYDVNRRELAGYVMLPRMISSDEYTARIKWHPGIGEDRLGKSGFTVEARVIMTNGRTRTSHRLNVPFSYSDEKLRPRDAPRNLDLRIPYFAARDTLLTDVQRELISHLYNEHLREKRRAVGITRPDSLVTIVVQTYGTNEYSENSALDAVTMAALHPRLRAEHRRAEEIQIASLQPVDSLQVTPISISNHRADGVPSQDQPDTINVQTADARFANARARSVVRYLVDSVGVQVDTLGSDGPEFFHRSRRMEDGVPGTFVAPESGTEYFDTPEERAFRRYVFLEIGVSL